MVARVEYEKLTGDRLGEQSEVIRARFDKARVRQRKRFARTGGENGRSPLRVNADMGPAEVRSYCELDESSKQLIRAAMKQKNLSAWASHRILNLARTIAELADSERIETPHLAEAIQYRRGAVRGEASGNKRRHKVRQYFALSILFLTACLPVPTLSALPTPSTTPGPSNITWSLNPTVSPSPAPHGSLVRIDPVLYTYWISGPQILELVSEVHATELATGKQTLLFKAPEASTYMAVRNVVSSAWSPGGERVLVSFTNYTDRGGSLRLITADSNLTTPLFAEHPAVFEYALWSPDGQHIVMRQARPQACLMIANLDDGKLRELAPCDPLEYPRFWSTDGKWIAIYRVRPTDTIDGNWFAVAVDEGKRVALEQLQAVEWYDQRYRPWRVTSKFACTWPTDPQYAKQFSFWRCE